MDLKLVQIKGSKLRNLINKLALANTAYQILTKDGSVQIGEILYIGSQNKVEAWKIIELNEGKKLIIPSWEVRSGIYAVTYLYFSISVSKKLENLGLRYVREEQIIFQLQTNFFLAMSTQELAIQAMNGSPKAAYYLALMSIPISVLEDKYQSSHVAKVIFIKKLFKGWV